MSNFESIFDSNTNTDPALDGLFKKRKLADIDEIYKSDEETDGEEEELDLQPKGKKKLVKLTKETEERTVFIGNLDIGTKKEELTKVFKKFGKIEAIRFRNVVPEDITKSKKYAYITKQTHPNKKTMNGFIRFKDIEAAKKASEEMNGAEFKSLHIRVDLANNTKVHDNRKSVFLGGLPFDVSDEDVYSHFSSCGTIDYVRIIRDNKTGIGKGFGYVGFTTEDSISLALKLNESSLNSRKIRVNRCVKKVKKSKEDKNGKQADQRPNRRDDRAGKSNKKFGDRKQKNFEAENKTEKKKPKEKKKDSKNNKPSIKKKNKKKNISTNNKNRTFFKI